MKAFKRISFIQGVLRRPNPHILSLSDYPKDLLAATDIDFLLTHSDHNFVRQNVTRSNKDLKNSPPDANSFSESWIPIPPVDSGELDSTQKDADQIMSISSGFNLKEKSPDIQIIAYERFVVRGRQLNDLIIHLEKKLKNDGTSKKEIESPIFALLGQENYDDPEKRRRLYVCDLSHTRLEDINQFFGSPVIAVQLRSVIPQLAPSTDAAVLSIARGLAHYHRKSKFCSMCGSETSSFKHGTCRSCHGCGAINFPRQDPAMIALISCGDFCLLGRKAEWPLGRYSCLAGFTEIGEALEETVVREVAEESLVEVDLKSVTYVASQPWLFPQSLMFGFLAKAAVLEKLPESDEDKGESLKLPMVTEGGCLIRCNEGKIFLPKCYASDDELEDVKWFHKIFIQQHILGTGAKDFKGAIHKFHVPPVSSLARYLIDTWLQQSEENTAPLI